MHKIITVIILFLFILIPTMSYAEDSKSAILVVSFGTSMPEARKAIDSRESFPESEVRLAFTSNIIRRKIAREFGEIIPNPVQALAQLNDEGFKEVYVMPTHMIPGEEYDEILNVVSAFRTLRGKYGFSKLILGRPFLDGVDDCDGIADVLIERFKAYLDDKDTAIILMGDLSVSRRIIFQDMFFQDGIHCRRAE